MVSIIVPIYNSEKYLSKCIESILNQTYKDIELILVDDGSRDKSLDICNEYAKRDARVLVIHQENRGVSSARNKGLDIAKGRYIGFVDSDDYIAPDMIRYLVSILEEGNDFASCGWIYETERGEMEQNTSGDRWSLNGYNDILICMFKSGGCAPNVCNKLLIGDIIRKHNIRFPVDIKIGEDMIMLCEYVLHCSTGVYDPKALYHYVTRGESAYHKRFVKGNFDKSFEEEINAHKIVFDMLPEGRAKRIFLIKMYYVNLRTMKFMCYADYPDRDLHNYLIRFLRRNIFRYLFSRIDVKQKIHAILMSINPRLWYFLFKGRGN